MWDHSFTVKGGIEAVSNPTEHGHLEMKPDMIVECFVTSGMVTAEGTESGIHGSRISVPIYGDVLSGGHPAHGGLGHQIMETDVLILPVNPISLVYDLAIALLYHSDKEFGLDNRGTWGKFPSWGITVQALVNHCPDFIRLLFLAVFL